MPQDRVTPPRQLILIALLGLLLLPLQPAAAVKFEPLDTLTNIFFATGLALGPEDPDPTSVADGCLYVVAGIDRAVHRVCFDADKQVISSNVVVNLGFTGFRDVAVGIGFDPASDPQGDMALYVSYAREGAPFTGKIARAVSTDGGSTYVTTPDFITGLPRSATRVGHQTNSVRFGPDGCLYIGQGNMSDSGYAREFAETHLSGTILRACFQDGEGGVGTDPSFDGDCGGDFAQEACDLEVVATGLRNPFDFVFHSNGRFYATDNDTNPQFFDYCPPIPVANDFGCPCQEVLVFPIGDELNIIEEGRYYGNPNPYYANPSGLQCQGGPLTTSACTTDADCPGGTCEDLSELCTSGLCDDEAHCFYFGFGEPPEPGEDPNGLHAPPILQEAAFLDGISEYRADFDERFPGCFLSDWNGDLIIGGAPSRLNRVSLSEDGSEAFLESSANLNNALGLDVVVGPDGTIYTSTVFFSRVDYLVPIRQPNPSQSDFFRYCQGCADIACVRSNAGRRILD